MTLLAHGLHLRGGYRNNGSKRALCKDNDSAQLLLFGFFAMFTRLPVGAVLVTVLVTQLAAPSLTPAERERKLFIDAKPGTDGLGDQHYCSLKNGCDGRRRQPTYYDGADRSRAAEEKGYSTELDR